MTRTDPQSIFEGNIGILRLRDRELAERLSAQRPDFSAPVHYRFLEARNGDPVPALTGAARGADRPLHSLVDPRREGERLISTLDGEDFLIFLGLGAGYHVEAALKRPETDRIIIVEFGLRGFAELLGLRDLRGVIADRRVWLLVDPLPGTLEHLIPELYLPALSRAIRTLPLRPRVETAEFDEAANDIRAAIGRITADYSVQAHFGMRMFKNTLRNLLRAENSAPPPRIRRAVVCGAGPSLDSQIPRIAENRGKAGAPFLIATDTSLPALLSGGLEPDAVISIDCQHIGYRHFIPPPNSSGAVLSRIPLFLDLASPPSLASLTARPVFFSAGHPLSAYIAARWRPFPRIDGSGGNVTHAAVSLAETLGAAEIELYGADFSYPLGKTYARGTYIFPYFESRQNRMEPLEALFSRFLYRAPLEKRISAAGTWYYETETLTRYRKFLETLGERMEARLLPAAGLGAPIAGARIVRLPRNAAGPDRAEQTGGLVRKGSAIRGDDDAAVLPAREFLVRYREQIRGLEVRGSSAGACLAGLGYEDRQILATLLPLAAALRRKEPERGDAGIIERTRDYAAGAIDQVLAVRPPAFPRPR
ncbi:MAG: DUF115 domain-containing protein [Treponema sp.]|jgi:hypothetical protein|nr:DUF115 domain-containing protein [Treponema sp.]